ncbi:MAG: YdcF family protein [Bacteroidia bacterium]|jgi:uncharacterized SAM-binding protein YcdF (DUF218 family)|nr:YdcF family protein [Bacteroidia bacterium]
MVFFYLSKLLAFLLSPMFWAFFLLLFALLAKNPKRGRKLLIAALCLLYLSGNSFLVDECFRAWEPVTEDYKMKKNDYEAAIVLGGIGDIDLRKQQINFGYSADRLFQVLPLYHRGFLKHIVFTGGSGSIEFPEKKEGLFVKKYLLSINIPDSVLIIESESKNTYQNAVYTKHVLDSLGIKGRFLLVTSGSHMPRALAIFKKLGFDSIDPFVTNRHSGNRRFTPDHLLIPNPGAMMSFQQLIHEWVGFMIYKLRGYA